MKIKEYAYENGMIIKVRIESSDKFSEREFETLNNKKIKGVLNVSTHNTKYLEFCTGSRVSLLHALSNQISNEIFQTYIYNIAKIIKSVQESDLFISKLLLDLRYIYVSMDSKDISLIYVPLVLPNYTVDLNEFFRYIAFTSIAGLNQSVSFRKEFIDFIKSQKEFSAQRIIDYALAHNAVVDNENANSGFLTDKPKEYVEHYDNKKNENHIPVYQSNSNNDTNCLLDDEGTTLLDEYKDEHNLAGNDIEDTALLNEDEGTSLLIDEENTSILFDNNAYVNQETNLNINRVHFPSLYRISTGETVEINKPVFRIGKEKSYVDYFVSNNNAVSRSHADVIKRGENLFIYDHNSKNGTYINSRKIDVNLETPINFGDIIMFGNEKFELHR